MTSDFSLRRGEPGDSYAIFRVFKAAIVDLMLRTGLKPDAPFDDAGHLAKDWAKRAARYDHLAVQADQFWVAENNGEVIGFARSIVHGGVRELTEFFVRPGVQSGGVGAALFEKAFPRDDGLRGSIIATLDVRAQARYIKSGMVHRFLFYYLARTPAARETTGRLRAVPLEDSAETCLLLDRIDRQVLGFTRPDTHEFLLTDRKAYAYIGPDGEPAGYGFVGRENGPFALLEAADYPQVLAFAETEAAALGYAQFGVEVPTINRAALETLLARGFRIDPFYAVYMSSQPLAKAENYILTSPPFVL